MSELVRQFEDCTLTEFPHADHVRVAWEYLRDEGVAVEALRRFATNLRRFAAHKGKPGLYHETITWAYVALIHERMLADPDADATKLAIAGYAVTTTVTDLLAADSKTVRVPHVTPDTADEAAMSCQIITVDGTAGTVTLHAAA